MKNIITLFIFLIAFICTKAQGALQFSQAKIVDNTLVTVPAGKVWKVTAIYGAMYNTYCTGRPDLLPTPSQWVKASVVSGFEVNGKKVFSIFKYSNSSERFSNNTCTTSIACCTDYSSYSQSTDPLILPIWLPAGTTLKSLGTDVSLSVIEFNVIP